MTDWVHSHYFTNFHCFLYVYTPCTTVSFVSKDPRQRTEAPPGELPALEEAIDEEAHGKQLAEQRALEEAENAKVAAKVASARIGVQKCPVRLSGA